jgi:dipeptidyl-peptidase-4
MSTVCKSSALRRIGTFTLALVCVALRAQSPAIQAVKYPSAAFREQLDALINQRAYGAKAPAESRWLDGGERYTVIEAAADGKGKELVAYETATGRRSVLVSARQLTPAGAKEPLAIDGYEWSADKSKLLIFTNSRRVWRENTRGDYWVLELGSGSLRQLGQGAAPSTLMFATFAPDGRSVGYVRGNNLYVEELTGGSARQLTTDGSADIINGTSDWVNEEELAIRDAFRWSPDSKSIAYWQFDQSGVGEYSMIDDTKELYPTIFRYKYPLVGTTNSAVRVGVVPAAGGATVWVKTVGDPRNHYIPRMDWAGNSDELAVEWLNRAQNHEEVYLANARTGEARVFFEDRDAAFLDIEAATRVFSHFVWLGKGAAPDLLWLNERDGWRHAYRISRATGEMQLLTDFAADVISPVSVDEAHGQFYFLASPGDPIRSYLFRAGLDTKSTPERLTPAGVRGMHRYAAAPDGRWAIHSVSSADAPPRYELVELPSHRVARVLEENASLAAKVRPLLSPAQEFFETPVGDGVTLSTFMIKPPGFDPAKKYPVLVYIYGEPASQTVVDSWGGGTALFLRFIAAEGYVVLSFDNQGTPAPRGRAWRKAGYGAIGVLSSAQQAAALREFAREHSFLDTTRMAIWGWSGGGTNTLNMMFRYPGLFSTGIAVAAVPDQTRYDTIYQERYMGLPTENAKGYQEGSAIHFADRLAGNLLLVHGSGDDNVHFQGAELMVNRLIALGKTFDFMDYPNRTHAIAEGPGTRAHLYNLIARYLEDHVPPGGR